jgi:hypothetical protein
VLALTGPQGRNVDPSTLRTFEILLKRRLFDYARHRGFRDLRQLENLDVVTKFVESWQNLNPHRNKSVFQQKTEDWVCIPIPDFVEELRKLKFKGTKDGCHYWFWTCEGGLDTAITNWRERVFRLLAVA